MTSKVVQEPLIMRYEQILNFIIRKFKSSLPLVKRLKKLLMEKANLLVEKASQAPRNVVKIFIPMGALHTTLRTLCTQIMYKAPKIVLFLTGGGARIIIPEISQREHVFSIIPAEISLMGRNCQNEICWSKNWISASKT